MLKNYIKITLRSLLKEKVYTGINVLGLTLGIAAFIVVFLIVRYEMSFDKFHKDSDKLYRIVRHESNASGKVTKPNIPYPFAQAFREEFPELKDNITLFHFHDEEQVDYKNEKGYVGSILFAEPQLFDLFDFKVISGNPKKDLAEPNKLFITPEVAQQYFGDEPSLGKTIKLGGTTDFEVVGMLERAPSNSHIQYDMIVAYSSFTKDFNGGFNVDKWGFTMSGYGYLKLPDNMNATDFDATLNEFTAKFYTTDAELTEFHLQPFEEVHFDARYSNGAFPTTDRNYILMLVGVGFFILLIACINFINMSTALATKRAKEVGVRKTLGASRGELIRQFIGETFFISIISMVLAVGIVERLMPNINTFLEKEIAFYLFSDYMLLSWLVGLLAFVTLASGGYPAIVLSRYQAVSALKSSLNSEKSSGMSLRSILVGFQFIISQILIIATIIISSQMDYFMSKPLGFQSEAVITMPLMERDSLKLQTFKQGILQNSNVVNMSYGVGVPISDNNIGTGFAINERGLVDRYDIRIKVADEDYLKTFGLEMVAGSWIDQQNKSGNRGLVVNEAAIKVMGFEANEAIGKEITLGLNRISAPITGVVKDFHTRSLHTPIEPIVLLNFPSLYYEAGVRVNTENLSESLDFLKGEWEKIFPEYVFQYEFLDDYIARQYKSEKRTQAMFNIFSGISILIACIGLFGLISFVVTQKTKEVGIRKVLGASIANILLLISSNFLKIMVVGFFIATAIVWYGTDIWLNNFAYRIDVHLGYFAIGLVATLIITLLTIGIQTYKAAVANPVDALRDE